MRPMRGSVLLELVAEPKRQGMIEVVGNVGDDAVGRGRVIAVGRPQVTSNGIEIPVEVKAGDVVLFQRRAGIKAPGGTIVNVDALLGIVEH